MRADFQALLAQMSPEEQAKWRPMLEGIEQALKSVDLAINPFGAWGWAMIAVTCALAIPFFVLMLVRG